MTPTAQIAAIRQRAEQATPGPWQIIETRVDDSTYVVERRIATEWIHGQLHGPAPVVNAFVTIEPVQGQKPYHGVRIDEPDAEFIAHAREDIPFLLNQIDARESALRALVAQWKQKAEWNRRAAHDYTRCADDNCASIAQTHWTLAEGIDEQVHAVERLLESEQ